MELLELVRELAREHRYARTENEGVVLPRDHRLYGLTGHRGDGPHLARRILPGADDNASGTAVLLEVAERLKSKEPALGIDICLLAAEERGLFGSRDWVTRHAKELNRIGRRPGC